VKRIPGYRWLCHKVFLKSSVSLAELSGQHDSDRLAEESRFIAEESSATSLPANFRRHQHASVPEARRICAVPDATIVGTPPILYTSGGRPIVRTIGVRESRDFFWEQYRGGRRSGELLLSRLLKPIPEGTRLCEEGVVLPLIGRWCTSYYHWFTEYLPQVRALQAFGTEMGQVPKLLLPTRPPDWMVDSLRGLGIERGRIRRYDGKGLRVGALLVTERRPQTGGLYGVRRSSVDDLLWVRDQVLSRFGEGKAARRRRRIYLSRQQSGRRRVKNYDSLWKLLETNGFECFIPENLAFREQVRLLEEAEYVVGPHGGGLTNLLFAPEGTRVLELLPTTENTSHYFALSRRLGHQYAAIVGDEADLKGDDFVVDLEQLKANLP
jgi:capsular polysaccharide biosynthesis protein